VAGPDHLHADQAITALRHGCHVLIEKPLATTTADAQRIIDAESETGLRVMADHTMRYMPPWGEMARAAKSGRVGEIFFAQGDYIHDMWEYYSPVGPRYTPWRIDQEHPQNILLGGGCHPIDLILWTVEAPVAEVHAYSSKMSIPEFPSDDCYVLIMRFENGVLAKVYVTSGCSGHGMGGGMLAVYGTEGTLWKGKLIRRGQETIELEDRSAQHVVGGHGWGGAVVEFLDFLQNKIENPIPARSGARTVAVCEAALQSIQSGQPQRPVAF
jgi:predicted dehydrogenase